jgi:hypothetical protein
MIDPLLEELITPTEATALYPRGPSGRKVHVSRVYRDIECGFKGIKLESIRTPRLATSRQAVARYFRRLSEASNRAATQIHSDPKPERTNHEVERELDRLGI